MSQIAQMLRADEGFSPAPYIDTEGYPTIGTGLRIGPKGAKLANYTFSISHGISDAWMQEIANGYRQKLAANPKIAQAWQACDEVRKRRSSQYGLSNGLHGVDWLYNHTVPDS